MTQVKIMRASVNGKLIAFTSETVFILQVSRNNDSKSSYRTIAKYKGSDFPKMANHYKKIIVENGYVGYRKRILMSGSDNVLLKNKK